MNTAVQIIRGSVLVSIKGNYKSSYLPLFTDIMSPNYILVSTVHQVSSNSQQTHPTNFWVQWIFVTLSIRADMFILNTNSEIQSKYYTDKNYIILKLLFSSLWMPVVDILYSHIFRIHIYLFYARKRQACISIDQDSRLWDRISEQQMYGECFVPQLKGSI